MDNQQIFEWVDDNDNIRFQIRAGIDKHGHFHLYVERMNKDGKVIKPNAYILGHNSLSMTLS